MRYQIRAAQIDDLAEIIQLNRRTGLSEWSEESYREAVASKQFLLIVIELPEEEKNRIAGFAVATVIFTDLEILRLAVKPSWQRRGLGSVLLQHVLEWGKEQGCKRCLLEVNADNQAAIHLYKKYDFVELYRRKNYYSHPPGDALVMESRLHRVHAERTGRVPIR